MQPIIFSSHSSPRILIWQEVGLPAFFSVKHFPNKKPKEQSREIPLNFSLCIALYNCIIVYWLMASEHPNECDDHCDVKSHVFSSDSLISNLTLTSALNQLRINRLDDILSTSDLKLWLKNIWISSLSV